MFRDLVRKCGLVRFLHITRISPKRVVFIDDLEDNLESVESWLQAHYPEIKYEGVHYLGASAYPSQPISEEEFEAKWQAIAARAKNL